MLNVVYSLKTSLDPLIYIGSSEIDHGHDYHTDISILEVGEHDKWPHLRRRPRPGLDMRPFDAVEGGG